MDNKYAGWIKKNVKLLRIHLIEKEIDMPEGTLKKYADGARPLPEKWHAAVEKWVKKNVKELLKP